MTIRKRMLGALLVATVTGAVTVAEARPKPAASADPKVVEASISDLQSAMSAGRFTSRQIVEAYLKRIAAYDQAGPSLNAIVTVNPNALAEADALDQERRSKGPRGPLHGIPVLVKDNFGTAEMPTSAGTVALATLRPTEDSFQVAQLRRAGAIILGKTSMDELAVSVTTISSLTGMSRNPYDIRRSPGGSSGGSAAAVAASFAAAALGTDTCGSIRVPAAWQGLYGLRVSEGLSSRAGIIPLSPTQDVAGPIARSVKDLAILLDATVAADPADKATLAVDRTGPSYVGALHQGELAGARIGVLIAMLDPQIVETNILKTINAALDRLKAQGAVLVDVAIPDLESMAKNASVIAFEADPALTDYLSKQPTAPVHSLREILDKGLDHDGVDATLQARLASAHTQEAYREALAKRDQVRKLLLEAMTRANVDTLAYPVSSQSPAMWGTTLSGRPTCSFSATSGLPAITFPAGLAETKLPVGIELLGRALDERRLLNLAYAWESVAEARIPPSSTPPLVDGAAPKPLHAVVHQAGGQHAAAVQGAFRYDIPTSMLKFDVRIGGSAQDRPIAITLHRAGNSGLGPVIAVLATKGVRTAAGEIYVDPIDREALVSGKIYLQVYSQLQPLGSQPMPLALKRP